MKVLIADRFPQDGIAAFEAGGCVVRYEPDLKADALGEALVAAGADVLVVRGTEVPGAALRASRLSVVVRAGAGYNTIDVATASELGIFVTNCLGKNAIAVAELAMGLILALDRHVVEGAVDLRAGTWNKTRYSKARGLAGRTLGIVGLGSIGQEVAKRARAFDMRVVAWSRSHDDARAEALGIERLASPVEVARAADVVSVHLALKPETRGLLGAAFFGALQRGSLFVNTARAEVVDEAALLEAVRTRSVRAGLDVFAGEPAGGTGAVQGPLFVEPGIIGSHHIGASTDQAQDAVAAEAVRIVLEYKRNGSVPNCVNMAKRTRATHLLVVRHRDRVGVLAHVFEQLRSAGINAQQTENVIFEGGQAAVARIQVASEPDEATLRSVREGSPDVLDVAVVPIG